MERKDIRKQYEESCNEYVKEFCKMYDFSYEDGWWVADYIGEVWCTSDIEYSVSMTDIKVLVNENVPYEVFKEWWDYNLKLSYADIVLKNPKCSSINLRSWLAGCPKPYNEEEIKEIENLYWKSL